MHGQCRGIRATKKRVASFAALPIFVSGGAAVREGDLMNLLTTEQAAKIHLWPRWQERHAGTVALSKSRAEIPQGWQAGALRRS